MLVKEQSLILPFLDTLQAQSEVHMLGGIPLFFKHIIYIRPQQTIMIIIIKSTC